MSFSYIDFTYIKHTCINTLTQRQMIDMEIDETEKKSEKERVFHSWALFINFTLTPFPNEL